MTAKKKERNSNPVLEEMGEAYINHEPKHENIISLCSVVYTFYDYSEALEVIGMLGLAMDWAQLLEVDRSFYSLGYTQEQANYAVIAHANIVNDLFTPSKWKWKARISLALMFLGIVRKPCGKNATVE